jgi:hypothetical protein
VNKIRQNTVSIFLVIAMLFTGNFAFAISHIDCMVEETTHYTCEMECCQEDDCCDSGENSNSEAVILSGDNCCEVHIEQAVEQDYALLLIAKTTEKQKYETLKADLNIQSAHKPDYNGSITYKFISTNIYLAVSNLRI